MFIPDGFGQVTLNFDYVAGPSNPMAIVHGYSHAGFNPNGHAAVIADQWIASVMGGPDITNNLLFKGVDVLEDSDHKVGTATRNVVGPSSDKATLPQVAVLIRKNTGVGGRPNRGRMYLPGCTDATFVEGGFLLAAAQTRLQDAITNYRLGLEGVDLDMVLLHNLFSSAPTPVISLSVDSVAATQRRRIR